MANKQHIYFCADNKYVPFATVTMASILVNASDNAEIYFHIIGNNISDDIKNKTNELKNIKKCNINFINIDDKIFDKFRMNMGYLSMATFYRFLIPSIAPEGIEKVLYLDGDMIVTSSLDELFATDLSGYMAGVVEEKDAFQTKNLSLKSNRYFNAGMILFNLPEIEKDKFIEQAFEYYAKMKDKIISHDQCILNGIMDEKVKFLDQKYNVPSFVKNEKNPIIIHYTGFMKKPWLTFSKHKLKNEWRKYEQLTAYKKTKLELLIFDVKEFLSRLFLFVKDPTHKKYYIVHFFGIKFGIGKKDNKLR